MMNKEYIDRASAIKMIEEDLPEVVYYRKEDAIACLECLPSADVVEVVRCKNCGYRDGIEDICGNIYCRLHDGRFDKDGYCNYGERRAEE